MKRKMMGGIAADAPKTFGAAGNAGGVNPAAMGKPMTAPAGGGMSASSPGISPDRAAFRQEQRGMRQSGASPAELMANRNEFRTSQGRAPIAGPQGMPVAKPGIEPAPMGMTKMAMGAPAMEPAAMDGQRTFKKGGFVGMGKKKFPIKGAMKTMPGKAKTPKAKSGKAPMKGKPFPAFKKGGMVCRGMGAARGGKFKG